MNRLQEKLGRECTDWDFDVQQELLERAQREVRQLKAVIWAIAWNAPKHTVAYFSGDLNPYDDAAQTEIEVHDYDMTTHIRAFREARPSNSSGNADG